MNLQALLATASHGPVAHHPHHPVTCSVNEPLSLTDDGALHCPHTSTPPNDHRTRECINHSVALLIIELAYGA